MDAQLKISRCKTRLLLQQPFWGALAMSTEFIEDNTIMPKSMCTNGRWIRWHREFVDKYTEAQIMGVIVQPIEQHGLRIQVDVKKEHTRQPQA